MNATYFKDRGFLVQKQISLLLCSENVQQTPKAFSTKEDIRKHLMNCTRHKLGNKEEKKLFYENCDLFFKNFDPKSKYVDKSTYESLRHPQLKKLNLFPVFAAVKCTFEDCGYTAERERSLRDHIISVHKVASSEWKSSSTKIFAQAVHRKGPRRLVFEIEEDTSSSPDVCTTQNKTNLQDHCNALIEAVLTPPASSNVVADAECSTFVSKLDLVKGREFYGFTMEQMYNFTQPLLNSSSYIDCIKKIVLQAVRNSEFTAKQSSLELLNCISGFHTSMSARKKPYRFQVVGHSDTTLRYSNVFSVFLQTVFNILQHEFETPLNVTSSLVEAANRFGNLLASITPGADDTQFDHAQTLCIAFVVEIVQHVLDACTSAFNHFMLSVLLSFCVVEDFSSLAGIRSFRYCRAQEVSSEFAAIQYCMRVISLKYYIDRNTETGQGFLSETEKKAFRLDSNGSLAVVRNFLDVSGEICKSEGGSSSYEDCFFKTDGHGPGACGVIENGVHFPVSDLTKIIKDVQEKQMSEITAMFTLDGINIIPETYADSLLNIVEDPGNLMLNQNFLTLAKNTEGKKAASLTRHLLQKMVGTILLQLKHQKGYDGDKLIATGSNLIINRLRQCDKILRYLIFLIHVTGGSPARGTELSTLKTRNEESMSRSFFVIQGLMCYVIEYNKTRHSQYGSYKKILRAVDPITSKLLGLYIALIDPYWGVLTTLLKNGGYEVKNLRDRLSTFVKSWTVAPHKRDEYVRNVIFDTFSSYGKPMNTRSYRQWQAGISNCNKLSFTDVIDYEEDETPHEQAGRSRNTGISHYGKNASENFKVLHPSVKTRMRLISEGWHKLLHIDNSKNTSPVLNHMLIPHTVSDRYHCSETGIDIKSKSKDQLIATNNSIGNASKHYETNFQICNNVNQIRAAADAAKCNIRKSSHFSLDINFDDSNKLRAFLCLFTGNENAAFLSKEQEESTFISWKRKESLLCILPTGAGKSMTFLLPAFIEQYYADGNEGKEMVTVVILPTVTLVNDMLRRCNEKNIRAVDWKNRKEGNPTVVFTIGESVANIHFKQFVDCLIGEKRLSRVVVDEAHLVMEWGLTFRHAYGSLGMYLRTGDISSIPVLLLTGSLALNDEPQLLEMMNFSHPYTIIRLPVGRTNIAYSIIPVKHGRSDITITMDDCLDSELKNFVRFFSTHRNTKSRAIVYCTTIAETDRIHNKLLRWKDIIPLKLHSRMDEDDKRLNEEFWRDGKSRGNEMILKPIIMIATSSFGLGVDYPEVRVVINYGLPYSISDFIQQSGRAGRDNYPCKSILIYDEIAVQDKSFLRGRRDEGSLTLQEKKKLQVTTFATQKESCRRVSLFSIYDRTTISCIHHVSTEDRKPNYDTFCDVCLSTRVKISNIHTEIKSKASFKATKLQQSVQYLHDQSIKGLTTAQVSDATVTPNIHLYQSGNSKESRMTETMKSVKESANTHHNLSKKTLNQLHFKHGIVLEMTRSTKLVARTISRMIPELLLIFVIMKQNEMETTKLL